MALVEGANNKIAPPKFISDADMVKSGPPKFISDEEMTGKPSQPMGRGEAAITTLADSTTGGLLPTISGLQEGWEAAKNSPSISEAWPNAKKAFEEARSQAQSNTQAASDQYPYQTLGVGLVGGAVPAAILPGGTAMKSVAGGLLSGAGHAIGHANTIGEAAQDVGTGAVVGGGLGLLGAGIRKVGSLSNDLSESSDKFALKGAGFGKKDFEIASGKGKIGDLANTIRNDSLLKTGDSVEDVAKKTGAALDDSGDKLNSIWGKLKDAASSDKAKDLSINDQIDLHGFDPGLHKDEVLSTLKNKMKGEVGATGAINKVSGYLDDLAKDYPEDLKPSDIRDIRQKVDQVVNWSKKTQELPANQKAFAGLANFIRDKIDTQANAASKVGFPDLADALKSENKRMSNLITIGESAADKVSRNDTNRLFSPTDYASGLGGAAIGAMIPGSPEDRMKHAAEGAGLGLINKGLRTYGPGLMSSATNIGSKIAYPGSLLSPATEPLGKGIQSAAPAINQILHRPDVVGHKTLGK